MSKYPGVKRLPSGKFLTEEQHLMDSINRADPIDLRKRAWCSLKKAIELNLYITETALWGTIIALKRVRALKRDMLKTSPKEGCPLRTGRTRNFGLGRRDQKNHPHDLRNIQKGLNRK